MKITRFFLTVIAVWSLGFTGAQAQDSRPAQEKSAAIITRTIDVKNAEVVSIIDTLRAIAKANGTTMAPDLANRLIILSGDPDRVAELEGLIHRLDVPPPASQRVSVELTAYLLVAGEDEGVGQPVPAQLEPALAQLRKTFTYKSYQLLDTLWMRNRVGRKAETTGIFPRSEAAARGRSSSGYTFSCSISHVTHDGKGDVIHLDNVDIITGSGRIETNIDIRPGQMVVVGKTSYEGDQAMIAVLSARIVD